MLSQVIRRRVEYSEGSRRSPMRFTQGSHSHHRRPHDVRFTRPCWGVGRDQRHKRLVSDSGRHRPCRASIPQAVNSSFAIQFPRRPVFFCWPRRINVILRPHRKRVSFQAVGAGCCRRSARMPIALHYSTHHIYLRISAQAGNRG